VTVTTHSEPVAIIADDEDLGRLLLTKAAGSSGLAASAFDNGLSALDAALTKQPSIVLLDVDMPGMDGYEVCRTLRKDARLDNVPIVMVTGHDDAEGIARAFQAGATDFVAKPVNWALLPRRIAYWLRNAAASRSLAERITQVRTLIEALPDTLWVVSADGRIDWSPNAPGDRQPVDIQAIAPSDRISELLSAIRQTAADGNRRTLAYTDEAQSRSYELRFSRRESGDVVVVRQDTTERTAAAERIERLAYFDPLTGLPNRQRCLESAEKMFDQASRLQQQVAIIYLDLNSFKRINDTFGHSVGDAVLRMVSDKLTHAVAPFRQLPSVITPCRFGGDEFIILLQHAAAQQLAMGVAAACNAVLSEPIEYAGLEFHSAPSIGIAAYPQDGKDVATVLKHADTAMYHAKTSGVTPAAVYTAAMSSRLRDWLELESRLRRAVQNDRLNLVYQPKYRLHDNVMVGVEALLRWVDDEHGDISPTRFVEIAEDSGLIIDMGSWVIRSACRQLRKWMDRGIHIPIAVNVSAKELLHADPARVVEAEAAAAGVPTSMIEIEITESLLVKESGTVRAALEGFRRLGCRIALDDFGTGYSSLAYITRFPPDRIKIDKAFVREVDRSASDAAIANAILSLGQSLNLTITAEGVERQAQLEWLRSRGCHEAQGFLLSGPLTPRAIEEKLLPQERGAADGLADSAR
jgi:diguanylate cyclase